MSLWALLFLLFVVVVVGSCCFVCLALATESWRGDSIAGFQRGGMVCLFGSSLRISSSGCTDFHFASC